LFEVLDNMIFNHMAIFAAIVNEGSFTQAAKVTGVPKSTVSLKLKELESELGVRLIHRTTRQLTLTDHGQQFYQQCQQLVNLGENATRSMQGLQKEPAGKLKLSSPFGMSDSFLPETLRRYQQRYPKVDIQLISTNQRVDILQQGIDIAFRFGLLEDSSMIARTIKRCQRWVLASPAYIEREPALLSPTQLRDHRCIVSQYSPQWEFADGKRKIAIQPHPHIQVTDIVMAKSLALKGIGICMLPDISAKREVEAGTLIPLLPNYPLEQRDLNLVYPSRNLQSAAVKCFIETIFEVYEEHQW